MDRQSAILGLVCLVKENLEQLVIEDTNQEVEAGIAVGDDRKQCRLFLSDGVQLQLIGHGQLRQFGNVELLQLGQQGDVDGFGGFACGLLVVIIELHSHIVRLFLPILFKQHIHRRLEILVLLLDLRRPQDLHDHIEVLLLFRCEQP